VFRAIGQPARARERERSRSPSERPLGANDGDRPRALTAADCATNRKRAPCHGGPTRKPERIPRARRARGNRVAVVVSMSDTNKPTSVVGTNSQDWEAPSRHTNETNSVTPPKTSNSSKAERELPTLTERVAEFREEYGHLARLRLTEEPGQRLRESLLEEHTTEIEVKPMTETENGSTVHEVDKRVPPTWEEAVEQLLEWYEDARRTTLRLKRGYEGRPEHEEFHKDAENSWMAAYQKRYFAELKGWVRETIGGTRPSGGECNGKFDNPHLALLTRTASSIPDGDRRAPVDHTEQVRGPWEGVYHRIRNRMRSLGFDGDEWDYYRKEEPHKSERGGSLNRCYTHEHVLVIVDGPVTAADFQTVMKKHVEECEWAGEDAHSVDQAVKVLPADEVEDVAAYIASYTGIRPTGLLERSIEYIAWAAAQWAANRKRRTRSNAAGWAATADACKQRFESDKSDQEVNHGEEIAISDRQGVEFECAECGSPWDIDQFQKARRVSSAGS